MPVFTTKTRVVGPLPRGSPLRRVGRPRLPAQDHRPSAERASSHSQPLATGLPSSEVMPAARQAAQGVLYGATPGCSRMARSRRLPLGLAFASRRLPHDASLRTAGTSACLAAALPRHASHGHAPARLASAGQRLGHGPYAPARAGRWRLSLHSLRSRSNLRHAARLATRARRDGSNHHPHRRIPLHCTRPAAGSQERQRPRLQRSRLHQTAQAASRRPVPLPAPHSAL